MKNPAFLLAASLITLAVAGAITQFVLIGLLGLLLFPAGFILAASALLIARVSTVSFAGAVGSAVAAWGGVVLVTYSAFLGGSLAYAKTAHRLHPGIPAASGAAWLAGAVIAILGAALLATGLRRYPEAFSPGPPFGWFVSAAAVFPASTLLFFLLSFWQPFTA